MRGIKFPILPRKRLHVDLRWRRFRWAYIAAASAAVVILMVVRSSGDERRSIQDFEAAGGGISENAARDKALRLQAEKERAAKKLEAKRKREQARRKK